MNKFAEPILFLLFALAMVAIFEAIIGWKAYIHWIYYIRPTLYRTEKTYMANPEKILDVDFNNMKEIFVKTDREKNIILLKGSLWGSDLKLAVRGRCGAL